MTSWKNKKVLGIGPESLQTLREASRAGAALVEILPVSDKNEQLYRELLSKQEPAEGAVSVRKLAAVELSDVSAWDEIVVGALSDSVLGSVLRRAFSALSAGGKMRMLCQPTPVIESALRMPRSRPAMRVNDPDPSEEYTGPPPAEIKALPENGQEPARVKNPVMLHVHNVQRCGGTGNFVYDMATCFPEYSHVALCVNDPNGDKAWIQAVSPAMRVMYAPQLTEALLNEIGPQVVCLHATAGKSLEGAWPWAWLQDGGKRSVISFHHVAINPIIPATLDVFVSEFVKARYEPFLGKQIKRWITVPPCGDLALFAKIARDGQFNRRITTAGKHCRTLQEAAANELKDWQWDFKPPGKLGGMPQYLKEFGIAVVWSGHQETWCRTVTEAMAAGCLTIAHRAGAIPEQIQHGVNGYLFDSREQVAKILTLVQDGGSEKAREIAEAGRVSALKIAGFGRLRSDLYPYLLKAALGSPA